MTTFTEIPKRVPPRVSNNYEQTIPKIIWQTLNHNVVPDLVRSYAESWIIKNPEYEYRFFDDSDIIEFISNEFPDYLAAYNSLKYGASKADLWRYLIIYKYGGVYADIDCKCVTPLREWVKPDATWVTHLGPNRDVCQWLLISVEKNQIFRRAAENSYENIVSGTQQELSFTGFTIRTDNKIALSEGSSPIRTSHPVMTIAGPTVLQQAAEDCLKNRSAVDIFARTQVVCVSKQNSCQMNGNVLHDYRNENYLRALRIMKTPHYETANSKHYIDIFVQKIIGRLKARILRWFEL